MNKLSNEGAFARRGLFATAAGSVALGGLPAAAQPAPPAPSPTQPLLIRGAHILSMDARIGDLPLGDILVPRAEELAEAARRG